MASPKGSVFCISPDGRLLQPLALSCLAHPSGVAVSPDEKTLCAPHCRITDPLLQPQRRLAVAACRYVCETMANRVLRFVQKPAGVFHFSVFHQFSGGLGPSGVTCDSNGNVYVGRMDFAAAPTEEGVPSSSSPGMVAVLSSSGVLLQETECPAAEVSGLVVSGDTLYVSEASTNKVYKMPTV